MKPRLTVWISGLGAGRGPARVDAANRWAAADPFRNGGTPGHRPGARTDANRRPVLNLGGKIWGFRKP